MIMSQNPVNSEEDDTGQGAEEDAGEGADSCTKGDAGEGAEGDAGGGQGQQVEAGRRKNETQDTLHISSHARVGCGQMKEW